MAELEIKTTVTGVEESKQKLGELGKATDDLDGKQKKSTESTKAARAALKDIAVTLTATAAVASIFARNNVELQENLQAFSLATAGAAAVVRVFGNVIKLVAAVPLVGIALAIGAVITATILLVQHWEEAKAAAASVWEGIAGVVTKSVDIIKSAAAEGSGFWKQLFTPVDWGAIEKGTDDTAKFIVGSAGKTTDAVINLAKKTVDVLTGNEQRKRQLAEQTADYEIRTGQATFEKKIALLKAELAASRGNKEEQLRLLNEIATTRENQVAREIADIKMISGLTKREQVEQLEILAAKYKAMGNEGHAAFRKIQEAIQSMSNDWGKVLVGIKDAWTGMFEDIFTQAKSFSEAWSAFWTNIKNIVLKKVAEIVANSIWDSFAGLFKGGGSLAGIGSLGGPAMAGIGAALALVVQLGTAEGRAQFMEFIKGIPQIIEEFVDNLPEIIDAFIDALPDIIEALIKAIPKVTAAISEALLITLPVAFAKAALSFTGEILKGAFNFTVEILKGAFNFVAEILKGAVEFVKKIIDGIAHFPGGGSEGGLGWEDLNPLNWFAHGGNTTVTRPTLFMAGERGAESVSVSPLSGGRSGSGINISFSGPVVFDDISMAQWARKLSKAMDHENRRFA